MTDYKLSEYLAAGQFERQSMRQDVLRPDVRNNYDDVKTNVWLKICETRKFKSLRNKYQNLFNDKNRYVSITAKVPYYLFDQESVKYDHKDEQSIEPEFVEVDDQIISFHKALAKDEKFIKFKQQREEILNELLEMFKPTGASKKVILREFNHLLWELD